MRVVQLAMLIMSIQFGLGFIQTFGGLGNVPYEPEVTGVEVVEGSHVQTTSEQTHLSFGIMSKIWKMLTWDWIKDLAMPWYSNSESVKALVDFILKALQGLTGIIYGAALIEFIANRVNVLR